MVNTGDDKWWLMMLRVFSSLWCLLIAIHLVLHYYQWWLQMVMVDFDNNVTLLVIMMVNTGASSWRWVLLIVNHGYVALFIIRGWDEWPTAPLEKRTHGPLPRGQRWSLGTWTVQGLIEHTWNPAAGYCHIGGYYSYNVHLWRDTPASNGIIGTSLLII